MGGQETQLRRRRQIGEWFDTPLGRSLEAFEANRLRNVLPNLFGTVAVQVGRLGRLDLMDACNAPTRIVLDLDSRADRVNVHALPEALPFESGSVDILVLPHALDFCHDPHQMLREVARVLSPEGHVVIFGFNPMSLWGARRLVTRRPRPAPWCGNFFRLARVKDWLSLLDFELTHGSMLFYRPPLMAEGLMERLLFLDKMGDRWWPLMAGVYLVVAKKHVAGMTRLHVEWKQKPAAGRLVASPSARGIVVPFQRRVKRLG